MMKTFATIKEVKTYVREFHGRSRYTVDIDGAIPLEEDVETIYVRTRNSISADVEEIHIEHLDFIGDTIETVITITRDNRVTVM